jgi:protein-S-isoprenylcysteine O-methyltransferase Ste14
MNSAYARWAARWRVPLGFLLAAAYLVFCQPTARLALAGGVIAAAGLVLRALAAGHLVKNQTLAMSGPYACTRHPLYLGSALVGAGFALAGGSWVLGTAFVLLFPAIYWPVMRSEEEFLRRQFGETYDRYAQQVPLFIPRWRQAKFGGTFQTASIDQRATFPRASSGAAFQWKQYWKNREYEAFLGFLAVMIFLAFKIWLR